MVLDIEPPIYILGLGAFHVEDTFVITEDGTQLLTSIDRSLQVVNI
jgi:Xaa-Pro aminopeptidase